MTYDLNISTIRWYFKNGDLHYRLAVAEHLEWLVNKDNNDNIPVNLVRELLDDPNDIVKEKALGLLSQIPEFLTESDMLCIIMHLKSKNRRLRDVVLSILPCLYWYLSPENVLSLIPLLSNWDEDIRRAAAEAIAELMHAIDFVKIDEVVSEIIPLLWNYDEKIRAEIACFLAAIGQDDILHQLSANQN